MNQEEILLAIDCQRQLLAEFPDDLVEQVALDSLYVALRETFFVIPGEKQSRLTRDLTNASF